MSSDETISRHRGGAPAPLFVYDLARLVAWLVSKPLWFVTFEGKENIPPPESGPVLVAANHQTYLDPVWICIPMRRRFRFMAFDKPFEWPVVGPVIKFLGAFPVKHPIDTSPATIKQSLRALREGSTLVIFPEGARAFEDGALSDFKSGAAKIAMRAGVPVLPVSISGGNNVWPQGRRFPRLFRRVRITFHPAILLDESKSAEEWTAQLRTIIGLDRDPKIPIIGP